MAVNASEPQLFLGFLISAPLSKILEEIDPKKKEIFIRDRDPAYLQKVPYRDAFYLGKFLDEIKLIEELTHIEKNIYTLVQKLVPKFSGHAFPLIVFPVFNLPFNQ